jgi:hypothetical protein
MAKPIFTIDIPNINNVEDHQEIQEYLQRKFNDYYVLVYSTDKEEIEFKCFFEKDFNEVKFEELKKIVSDNFNKINK